MLADPDQRAKAGLRWRYTDTQKRQCRLGDDRKRQTDGRNHQNRPHHIGQDMAQHDTRRMHADNAGGLHIFLGFLDHRRPAHDTGILHPVGQADGHDEHPDRHLFAHRRRNKPARHTEDQERDQDRREGQLHIGDAHQQAVDPTAAPACQKAQTDPQHHGKDHRRKAHEQRNPRAVKDGRKDIPALIVGAHQIGIAGKLVRLTRRGKPVHQVQRGGIERIIGGYPWRQNRCQNDDQRHVDDHEDKRDQHQVGRHHRHIDKADRVDEQRTDTRPLEDCFGDDRKGDDRPELQTRDRDNRHHRILERMAEVDRTVGQSTSTGEFDVIGPQHLKHLGPHEAHDQSHLIQAQRNRRQDQRCAARWRQQTRRPTTDTDNITTPEAGQPLQFDRKDPDQQHTDQEGRQGNPDQRDRHDRVGQPAIAPECSIDAKTHPKGKGQYARDQGQFQRGRQTRQDQLHHRLLQTIGNTEIALCGARDESGELRQERVVQTQLVPQRLAVGDCRFLPDHRVDRITHETEQGEGDQRHNQHHQH